MNDFKAVGLVDPVTNEMLAPGWKHPDDLPPMTEEYFTCLALVGVRPGDPTTVIGRRVHVARLNIKMRLIGGQFAFDRAPMVAWHDLPPLFLEST